MKKTVVFRVINAVKSGVSSRGVAWRSCEVIVAWSELGNDGVPHENRLVCKVRGESIDKLMAMQPTLGNNPVEVNISFDVKDYDSQDGRRLFNLVSLYL